MQRIRLLTRDSQLVGYAEIPPFQRAAEVVVWGVRTFVLKDNDSMRSAIVKPGEILDYIEGLAFAILTEVREEPWHDG